jgi:two-component system, NtrC family, nitrogen regulation response regulator NtrX
VRILVVDDDEAIRDSLDVVLRFEHHEVVTAKDGAEGMKRLAADPEIDLVFLDIKMPGRDGLEILPELVSARPDVLVVMISGHGTIETALEATRRGAFHFIEKPLDRDRVLLAVRNAHQVRRLRGENAMLRRHLSDASRRMIGASAPLEDLRRIVAKVAPTQARVLIQGENGAGKELVARLIHDLSSRAAGPFVDVNCAAIPRELLESELFGHEKGAFTGASQQRKGKFEQADGGTLFLDEVGDMSLDAQAKVLRVIEEQKVQRVGGAEPIPVDVRLVAATNKDLKTAALEGTFREDLYYRLAVVPIVVPPLRDRPGDVAALAGAFLDRIAHEMGRPAPRLTAQAVAWLGRQPWPGNVRQLKNLMERCVILLEGASLDAPDLERLAGTSGASAAPARAPAAAPSDATPGAAPAAPTGAPAADPADLFRTCQTFAEFQDLAEKLFLQQRLAANEWNVKRTAESLGMQRSHLYKKIERYGLK